jgi:hypothetical protein
MDLRRKRFDDRRAKLRELLVRPDGIQFSGHHAGDGEACAARQSKVVIKGRSHDGLSHGQNLRAT